MIAIKRKTFLGVFAMLAPFGALVLSILVAVFVVYAWRKIESVTGYASLGIVAGLAAFSVPIYGICEILRILDREMVIVRD